MAAQSCACLQSKSVVVVGEGDVYFVRILFFQHLTCNTMTGPTKTVTTLWPPR